jgi:UDP-2-acetamido-3-amino-2,3-dideoxy-glucuronate N-acetyltransferase
VNKFFVHKTAIIDEKVSIGSGTKIWAYSHISSNVSIGNNCTIGEGVHIGPNVSIGNNCKIQNHALLYEGVILEDNVFIGPSVVTTNDIFPSATGEWSERFRKTLFKKGCSVGANSTIICGIEVGEGSLIGAGSVVTKNVKREQIVVGNPAKFLKKCQK